MLASGKNRLIWQELHRLSAKTAAIGRTQRSMLHGTGVWPLPISWEGYSWSIVYTQTKMIREINLMDNKDFQGF
jgi:hypothetical protein